MTARAMRLTLLVLACLVMAAPAHAAVTDTPDADPPVTNGTIDAILRDGSTLYLGGSFSYVGRRTSVARLGADGRSTGTFPRVTDGAVEAILDDGAGGWYVGGSFATIGGADVPRLAHVQANGSVDEAFRPAPDGPVKALALHGGTLYAGGDFDAPRHNLMLLDPDDGTLLGAAPNPDGAVFELEPAPDALLLGGDFTTVGGQPRARLAALDGSATPTAWNPGADGAVRAIAISGTDVYLGGDFQEVAGTARARLAAVDRDTAALLAWNPGADRTVHDVVAAGDFDNVDGATTKRRVTLKPR